MQAYQKLKTIFSQLSELDYIQRIMMWDEAVMMPEGAGETRARALATLGTIQQKKLVNIKNKKLIAAAKLEENLSSWDQANLKLMERSYLASACIPTRLNEKLMIETLGCQQVWRKLRTQNDWKAFLPGFKRVFKLVKEVAKRRGDAFHLSPYDALLDDYAPGFNQASIDKIFAGLKQTIPQLVQQIAQKQAGDHVKKLQGPFAIEKQKQVGLDVMKMLRFDFAHGRLDVSHHPFCDGITTDVRITTRYDENELMPAILGICHETGHGLYEQGLPPAWLGQPVGKVKCMAKHESQSLLVEMQVCCSLSFYQYLLPEIQQKFGQQDAFNAENLYQSITRVEPSWIRVDADEVTYPLHIILRYELEKALLNDEIEVADLPARWDELMQKYLGITTRGNDKDGVMQDVHWPAGAFGYFPAYTLGRLMAAQFFAKFMESHPQFFAELRQGNFSNLKNWLAKNIYSQAALLDANELVMQVTGKNLDANYFVEHVKQRYL